MFRFEQANQLIEDKYNEIEERLIERFHHAFFKDDKKSMKKYLSILSNFIKVSELWKKQK